MEKKTLVVLSLIGFLFISLALANASEITSSCQPTNKCSGTTKIDCLKDWLSTSNCFSENYVDIHFSNFAEKTGENGLDRVYFDFNIDSNLVLSAGWLNGTGYAVIIEVAPQDYRVVDYIGPLKEYQLNINQESAFQKAKSDTNCVISNQSDILNFINLEVKDEFSSYYYINQEGKFTNYDLDNQSHFEFDKRGLVWSGFTAPCSQKIGCYVDAQTEKLVKFDNPACDTQNNQNQVSPTKPNYTIYYTLGALVVIVIVVLFFILRKRKV